MRPFVDSLRALLEAGQDLPTLPEMVFRLHAALEDEGTGAAEIGAIIERDPALTARLLRAANTVGYARGGNPVVSVREAVTRMGIRQIWSSSLALSVVQAFSGRAAQGLDYRGFWAHSAAVGATAQTLWREAHLKGPASPEDLYVAGLLHDAGILIMDQHFADRFAASVRSSQEEHLPLWQVEERRLGMDHGEIGGLLLGRWEMPELVAAAVSHHHHPDQCPKDYEPLARCVHAAEFFCGAVGIGLAEEGLGEETVGHALSVLGVLVPDTEQLTERLRTVALEAKAFISSGY